MLVNYVNLCTVIRFKYEINLFNEKIYQGNKEGIVIPSTETYVWNDLKQLIINIVIIVS